MMQGVASGLQGMGRAATVDAAKALGQMAKDTTVASAEKLTGTNLNPQTQVKPVEGTDPERQRQMMEEKAQAENARKVRLSQVRAELEEYYKRRKAREEEQKQVMVQRQQEEKQEVQKEESARKRSIKNLLKSAAQRGGTGESIRKKN